MSTTNLILLTVTVAAVGAVAWYVWQRERTASQSTQLLLTNVALDPSQYTGERGAALRSALGV